MLNNMCTIRWLYYYRVCDATSVSNKVHVTIKVTTTYRHNQWQI